MLSGLLNEETKATYTIDDGVSTPVTATFIGTPVGGQGVFTETAPGPGMYTVTVESLEIAGCVLTLSTDNSVVVEVKPNPTIASISASEGTICVGEDNMFTAVGLLDGVGSFDYEVDLAGATNPVDMGTGIGVTAVGGEVTVNLSDFIADLSTVIAGDYTIRVTSITRDGCTTTVTGVNATFTAVDNPTKCCLEASYKTNLRK